MQQCAQPHVRIHGVNLEAEPCPSDGFSTHKPKNSQNQSHFEGSLEDWVRAPTTLVFKRDVDAVLASSHARVRHESRDRFRAPVDKQNFLCTDEAAHGPLHEQCNAANSEIAALPRSTDSTHDPTRTSKSEVMVRVSPSWDETQKRTNSAVRGQSPEDTVFSSTTKIKN